MNHSNRQGGVRIQQQGFTLLEVIVVLIIIGMTSSWAIPNFHRSLLQGKIDRYMRNVESGLFSLRARMGAIKGSCLIDFGERSNFSVGKFVKAEQLLERHHLHLNFMTPAMRLALQGSWYEEKKRPYFTPEMCALMIKLF